MDENKEFTAESENITSESEIATDEQTEEILDNSAKTAFEEELSELNGEDETAVTEKTVPKKKFPVQVPIIIAAVIVACVALAFLVLKCFFNTSIIGTWTIENDTATSDEAGEDTVLTYYIFDKDGTVSLSYGTMSYMGTYSVSTDDDGNKSVEMYIPYAYLQATFDYNVSGNLFTGRKLVFSYDDTQNGETQTYKFKEAKRIMPELKAADDFKADDALVGEWNYYDGYYDYSYTFNSNGTVNINQNDMIVIEGTYKLSDDKITVTYYADDEYTQDLEYSVDGDTLVIQGMQYFKVGSASADEARASANSSQTE